MSYDRSKKDTVEFTKPCPTMTTLRTELEYMLRGTGHNEIWWLNMIEQQKSHENPRKVSGKSGEYWAWSYSDRVKNLLSKFLRADKKLRIIIQAAREDKTYWRGDDYNIFINIINETEKMREIGIKKYKEETQKNMKLLLR